MNSESQIKTTDEAVRTELIRDLVERYPDAMSVLSRFGIDVCCGGAHTVPDAAIAHGYDAEHVVGMVINAVESGGQ